MYCAGVEHAAKHFGVKFCQCSQGTKSLCRRLRALWSYNELGLTNHSVCLNVAIL